MGESLIQPCRVCEEGLRIVQKHFKLGKGSKLIPCCFDVTNRIGCASFSTHNTKKVQALTVNYWAQARVVVQQVGCEIPGLNLELHPKLLS